MGTAFRSYSTAGLAALAATAIALPAATPAGPVLPPTHTVAMVSDAPARAFAVRLLSSLEQIPAAATATPAAVAVPAAAASFGVPNIFPAAGTAILYGYYRVLSVVSAGIQVVQNVLGAIPIVKALAPQIGLVSGAVEQTVSGAVYNIAMVVALQRDPITALASFVNTAVGAVVGFIQGEISWAAGLISSPLSILAATKPAAAKTPAAAAANPSITKSAKATKDKKPAKAAAATEQQPTTNATDKRTPKNSDNGSTKDNAQSGKDAKDPSHGKHSGKHAAKNIKANTAS
ncbi:MAG: hypothetical protein WCE30_17395 [Mycobacterium sp.]